MKEPLVSMDDIPVDGTVIADLLGREVLVMMQNGKPRAFLNVCRHRGSLVCTGSGRRATLQCPYHAWTYGLDGSLLRAPRLDDEGGAEDGALGLVPLRLETWGPFVFVNPDVDAGTHDHVATGRGHDKFGIPADEALALAERVGEYRCIDLIGVHQHIGSQITKLAPFTESVEKSCREMR